MDRNLCAHLRPRFVVLMNDISNDVSRHLGIGCRGVAEVLAKIGLVTTTVKSTHKKSGMTFKKCSNVFWVTSI
jgi:hypothetical protein